METKNTNFRLTEETRNELRALYGSHAAGLELHLPGMLKLRQYTLYELRGMFTSEELTALVDSQNGTLLVVEYMANVGVMVAHLQDFEMLEAGISRHGADADTLIEKVGSLTAAQAYWLQDDINRFWEQESSKEKSLEKFIQSYYN